MEGRTCSNYEEDPFITDMSGEPKGQCKNCGWKEEEHFTLIQELTAEIERLRKREGNATIILSMPTAEHPLNTEELKIVDYGYADNIYMVEL